MLHGVKLLAVDDDEMSLEMLCTVLDSQGVQITKAANGKQAMELVAANPEIEIMLLDIEMPVMNGYEVLDQCKCSPKFRDIPIIVLTSSRDEKLKVLQLGAHDFIVKPYDLEELSLRVQNLVAARRQGLSAKRAKDEFLAIASHELRTPMHKIIALSDVLNGDGLNPDQKKTIEYLKGATWELTEIVKNIISHVRLEDGSPEAIRGPFSLREMVKDSLATLEQKSCERGVSLTLNIDDSCPDALIGIPYYIHTVIALLTENALKFTSAGTIQIAIKPERLEGQRCCIGCSISDTGVGIPSDFHEQIFEPFVQVDSSSTRRFGGIGLGLAVAKRMVELLGGCIALRSEPGNGSTFKFSFYCDLASLSDV